MLQLKTKFTMIGLLMAMGVHSPVAVSDEVYTCGEQGIDVLLDTGLFSDSVQFKLGNEWKSAPYALVNAAEIDFSVGYPKSCVGKPKCEIRYTVARTHRTDKFGTHRTSAKAYYLDACSSLNKDSTCTDHARGETYDTYSCQLSKD